MSGDILKYVFSPKLKSCCLLFFEIVPGFILHGAHWCVSGFIVADNFHNGNIRPPILLPKVIEQSRKDSMQHWRE